MVDWHGGSILALIPFLFCKGSLSFLEAYFSWKVPYWASLTCGSLGFPYIAHITMAGLWEVIQVCSNPFAWSSAHTWKQQVVHPTCIIKGLECRLPLCILEQIICNFTSSVQISLIQTLKLIVFSWTIRCVNCKIFWWLMEKNDCELVEWPLIYRDLYQHRWMGCPDMGGSRCHLWPLKTAIFCGHEAALVMQAKLSIGLDSISESRMVLPCPRSAKHVV